MTSRIIGLMAIWPLQYAAAILRGWASFPVHKLTGGPNLSEQCVWERPSGTRPFLLLRERIPLINLWRHSLPSTSCLSLRKLITKGGHSCSLYSHDFGSVSVDFASVSEHCRQQTAPDFLNWGPFILFSERQIRFAVCLCHRCWVLHGVTVVLLTACSWCLLYEQTMSFYETRGAHQCHRCHQEPFFLFILLATFPRCTLSCLPLNYEASSLNMLSFPILILSNVCVPLIPIHKSIGPCCATNVTTTA